MKVIVLVLVVTAMICVAGVIIHQVAAASGRRRSASVDTHKAMVLGPRAIRQLDRIMTEPTLIGSEQWIRESEKIINGWYGDDHQ